MSVYEELIYLGRQDWKVLNSSGGTGSNLEGGCKHSVGVRYTPTASFYLINNYCLTALKRRPSYVQDSVHEP